jgi:VWFA-related protein
MICMRIIRRQAGLSLALILLLLGNSYAQSPDAHSQAASQQGVATMSVDVKVVTLPVTVRDKKGQIVRNLTKDDFVLQEDGRAQVIKYFTQDTNLPLTLGLLVDTSLSQRNVLDQERNASKVFLDQMLTDAKDKAFLIHFDREVELLQDLTPSHDKLEAALQLLNTPQLERAGGGSSDPQSSDPQSSGNGQPQMHRGAGTLLYDAIFLASNELMKKQQGRKALIVLSDGDDRGSKESLQSAIEAAQRADTVVYSILFADKHENSNGFGGPGGMGRHIGWPGGGFPGVVAGGEAAGDLSRNPAWMARKFWIRFQGKREGVSTKFPRNRRSIKFTTASPRNCGPNTTWATRRTRPILKPAITRSAWRPNRRTWSSKPEMDIMRGSDGNGTQPSALSIQPGRLLQIHVRTQARLTAEC